ncbi:MAG TPA: DNA mismatch repair protein MutS, partial [Telluria sp.]|nr:DNA mismatch repair protein MutS [Telluria sp.]
MASMKDFADLKALKASLKDQEQARAIEKSEREKREQVAKQEAGLVRNALGGVKKLPESDRYVPNAAPGTTVSVKPARPRTQAEDDAAVLR